MYHLFAMTIPIPRYRGGAKRGGGGGGWWVARLTRHDKYIHVISHNDLVNCSLYTTTAKYFNRKQNKFSLFLLPLYNKKYDKAN